MQLPSDVQYGTFEGKGVALACENPRAQKGPGIQSQAIVVLIESDNITESGQTNDCKNESLLTRRPWLAFLLLNLITILWGTQHSITKNLLAVLEPSQIIALRFILASLVLAPCIRFRRRVILASLELSVYMLGGFGLQGVGLRYTSASRSAFLLYLNVKLVPIFSAVVGMKVVLSTWVSAAITATGTILLTYDGHPPNLGDGLCLASAVVSALYILRVDALAPHCPPLALSASSTLFIALGATAWAAIADPSTFTNPMPVIDMLTPATILGLLYLGVIVCAATGVIQLLAQPYVSASKAGIIYAMDPIYGAFFAHWFLGETLGPRGIVGAALISVAGVGSQVASLWGYIFPNRGTPHSGNLTYGSTDVTCDPGDVTRPAAA